MKGTPSFGKRNKKTHINCRRCGRHAFNIQTSCCAACGYGRTAKIRTYAWKRKTLQRNRKA